MASGVKQSEESRKKGVASSRQRGRGALVIQSQNEDYGVNVPA
jgi:hypothetical protein